MSPWSAVAIVVGALVLAAGVIVGPWPVYRASGYQRSAYYGRSVEALTASATTASAAPIRAGWAARPMRVPGGTPLAGYGDRRGRPSEGTHDELHVKALAFSTGGPPVIIATSDLLIVPENIADRVRDRLAERREIGCILFSASHTHSGPGAATPGFLARAFGGRFDRGVQACVVEAFVEAIDGACAALAPAEIATARIPAEAYLQNRTRNSTQASSLVDPDIDVLAVRARDGRSCLLVRYSAHATVIGADNMRFSGDYPGALQRSLESSTGATVLFAAGAVGSMGPLTPGGGDGFSRAATMGEALAERVRSALPALDYVSEVVLRGVDADIVVPPLQLRIGPGLRLSPVLLRAAGVDRRARITGIRLGHIVYLGYPADLSGEMSMDLKEWAAEVGVSLVTMSFCGDYVGYISPDAYYSEVRRQGSLAYETALMSWCGPDQEAYFTDLTRHVVRTLLEEVL